MAKRKVLVIVAAFSMVISACNFPLLADRQQEQEPDALATAVAQTIQAMNSQPQATQPPVEQLQPGLPTITPQPTFNVPPQPTAAANPCNNTKFITETIPDDTEFNPGVSFTKSWTFENTGTCTWNTNYKLAFITGDAMDGPASVYLPINVAPGAQIKIDVPLKAPGSPGTYTGYWNLQAQDNEQFYPVTVRIKTITVSFAVSSVYTNLKNVSPVTCPDTYEVDITIETSAAGKVTYQTETSDGGVSSTKTLNFNSAGAKIAEFDWNNLGVVGTTTGYWLKVFIAQPNNQTWGPINFNVTCT